MDMQSASPDYTEMFMHKARIEAHGGAESLRHEHVTNTIQVRETASLGFFRINVVANVETGLSHSRHILQRAYGWLVVAVAVVVASMKQ